MNIGFAWSTNIDYQNDTEHRCQCGGDSFEVTQKVKALTFLGWFTLPVHKGYSAKCTACGAVADTEAVGAKSLF